MPSHDASDVLTRLREEWRRLGRSPASRRALEALRSTHGAVVPARVGDLSELVAVLEPNGGLDTLSRARLVTALLERAEDPVLRRCLLQTLLPGIVSVARVLQFGDGIADDPRTFLADALSEAVELLLDWAGQHRTYAAPDLLGALRCRLRRRMLADKARRWELCSVPERPDPIGADTHVLSRALATAAAQGVTDVDLVYARCVLGFTATELATATGTTTGALRRRLVAAARPYVDAPS
ncbi:MAG TPA: hypothetical protein VGZ03_04700 [Acidimicrobiales bacterium]|jgi:hypothetical protein|nr:hypothetical protein [Acidimicrobiales bacterium]